MSNTKNFAKAWKDKLKGGKADKKKPSDFDKKALAQGVKVELEHTDDKKVAMEIAMDHLTEDPNYYDKLKQVEKVKKSEAFYGYKNTQATVSTVAQAHAETASPELIQYISASLNADVQKIRLAKGTLTVSKKDEGLYSAFFSNMDGQVVDEFENCTVEMLAKNLMVKGYYDTPIALDAPVKAEHSDEAEDRALIREKIDDHIAMFHQGQQPGEPIGSKGYVRIKYGNFELEIKKSMADFIKAHKTEQPTKADVKKALSAWRRNSKAAAQFRSDFDAAQALVTDWNQYGEDFSQVLHAMKMKNEK